MNLTWPADYKSDFGLFHNVIWNNDEHQRELKHHDGNLFGN